MDRPSVGTRDRLELRQAGTLVVLGLAAVFLLLGLLLVVAPRWGAALFGVPAPEVFARAYVRAIGFRDIALALYIGALTLFATRRALCLVLGLTVLIPVCDVALLMALRGLSSPAHLALHAVSAVCFAGLAIRVARTPGRASRDT